MSDATVSPQGASPAPSPAPAPASAVPDAARRAARYAAYVFWLMFLINLFNYADRFVFSGFSATIQKEFGFNDAQIGFLGGAFLLVYTLVALPFGYVADRISRKLIVSIGVTVWSIATALTALASGFGTMLGVRALVGIGEGSYYPAGTPMLAAYYPPARRASIMSRWAIGALTGGAVGFIIATVVKAAGLNWRQAFYIAAVPGLVLAVLIFFTREKVRNEDDPPASQDVSQGSIASKTREYLRIPTFRVVLATHALGFFALYSIATFLVIYLGDVYGTDAYGKAGLSDTLVVALPGVVLLVGGIAGNLIGSAWANRMSRRYAGARVRVGGLGFLLAAPAVALTLLAPYVLPALPFFHDAHPSTQVRIGVTIFVVFGLLASTALNIYNGPTGAALQDVVPPKERAAAGGVELTLAHLLGDVYAGPAVGALSVALGSWLGGKQIGLAMLLTCPVFLVASGIVGIRGSRHYAADVAALGSNADAMLGTHALEAEAARP